MILAGTRHNEPFDTSLASALGRESRDGAQVVGWELGFASLGVVLLLPKNVLQRALTPLTSPQRRALGAAQL